VSAAGQQWRHIDPDEQDNYNIRSLAASLEYAENMKLQYNKVSIT